MTNTIGMLTIGQSPRSDIIPEIQEIIGSHVKIIERGALDGLTRTQLEQITLSDQDAHLVTRLNDGTSIMVGKTYISNKIQEQLKEMDTMDIDYIILLCTAEFPGIISKKCLIKPAEVLGNTIRGLFPTAKLGVITPLKDQIPQIQTKWNRYGYKVIVKTANPYNRRE